MVSVERSHQKPTRKLEFQCVKNSSTYFRLPKKKNKCGSTGRLTGCNQLKKKTFVVIPRFGSNKLEITENLSSNTGNSV